MLLISLVASQKRRDGRLASQGHPVQVENSIIVAISNAKSQIIQQVLNAESTFRLVTCLQVDHVNDLLLADIPNSSHVFVLGSTNRINTQDSCRTSNREYNVRHQNVLDISGSNDSQSKNDMRRATWALKTKHILTRSCESTLNNDITIGEQMSAEGSKITVRRCSGCCRSCSRSQEPRGKYRRKNTKLLVQFDKIESKHLATALPSWKPGIDFYVSTQRLKVALMAHAVMWPGLNHLLEAWMLPVATFGSQAFIRHKLRAVNYVVTKKAHNPLQSDRGPESPHIQSVHQSNARDSSNLHNTNQLFDKFVDAGLCPDDATRWGWIDEYCRGLGQIMFCAPLPPQAIGERMDFVAGKLQQSAKRTLLIGVNKGSVEATPSTRTSNCKTKHQHKGRLRLFCPNLM